MSIFSPSVLQHIYQENIYQIAEPNQQNQPANPTHYAKETIDYQGNNLNKILVVTNTTGVPGANNFYLAEVKFLKRILQVLNIEFDDCAVFVHHKNQKLNEIIEQLQPEKSLIFSDQKIYEEQELSEKYFIVNLNGSQVLFSDGLNSIENDQEKKKLLWKNLQVMFDVQ